MALRLCIAKAEEEQKSLANFYNYNKFRQTIIMRALHKKIEVKDKKHGSIIKQE